METEKNIKPYNTVDFKSGFRAQLDSYNKPVLDKVDTTMWYDLLGAEIHSYGDWEYVKGTLDIYKRDCLKSPEKAAEYLITLAHKAIIYRNVEPELSENYSKEHNEMQFKIFEDFDTLGKESMFGLDGFIKFFEMCN